MSAASDTADEIWRAVEASNRAWLDGRARDVAALFADDVVFVAPDQTVALRGRDAMVQSYVDYVAAVTTHAFTVDARAVEVAGDTAVASYRFTVRYEVEGKVEDERGQEILVFARRPDTKDGAWKCVWRTQIFLGAVTTPS